MKLSTLGDAFSGAVVGRIARGGRLVVNVAFLALLALVATECLNHPRNNQLQPNKATAITFDGFYLTPNQQIRIFIQNNQTGQFDAIPHAPIMSSGSAVQDHGGANWYSFGASDVILPSGSQYWSAGPSGSNVNVAHVKAVGDNPPDSPMTLTTFDVGADTCINTYEGTSGISVISNCHSSTTPVATINATCGASGGDCCRGTPSCAFGENCSGTSCTAACGTIPENCCQGAPFCQGRAACVGWTGTPSTGHCAACGVTGEVCCADGCNAGSTCLNGRCQCGSAGLACCAGGNCDATSACINGMCTSCGTTNAVCCTNNRCNAGYTCVPGTPPRCLCGGLDESCCPNGGGCNPGFTCQNGLCGPPNVTPAPSCAAVGGKCGSSSGPFCCGPNTVCNFGTCKTCVPHGLSCLNSPSPCCSYQDTCVLNQSNGGSQCDIGDSQPKTP